MCFVKAAYSYWCFRHRLGNFSSFHTSCSCYAKITKLQYLTDASWCEKVANIVAKSENSALGGVVLAANAGNKYYCQPGK